MRWMIYRGWVTQPILQFSLGLSIIFSLLPYCAIAANEEKSTDGMTSSVPKVGNDAPDFTLEDAKGQEHVLQKMRGKTVLLIMGNRKIRKEDDKWAEAFRKDYDGYKQIVAYIVADMRSVPGFVPKRFIKSQLIKSKPPVTLLLDWKGKAHQAYRTQKKKPNLYLIHPKGQIAFHIKANFDKKTYQQLKKAVNEIQQSLPVDGKSVLQPNSREKTQ